MRDTGEEGYRAERHAESVVPMINVVFLLLVFFLMTATIAPPDPFEIDLPQALGDLPSERTETLYLARDGTLGFSGALGDAVWPRLTAWAGQNEAPLRMNADASTAGADIAALLERLATVGITSVEIVSTPR
ncbi:MAG: biopolymer transporter ExbD [Pseudomonadota bacterium]